MFKKGNNLDRVKQRFSLRKLNIGVCSVLLGLTFMSGNNNTVKAETTQNSTKLEESKAPDQSQTGPTDPQRVVVDASVAEKNNTNTTNPIDSGNSDTVKAETTQNPTKLEESKAPDQSQTGPTHPQTSVPVKTNTNDAEFSNATNSGNSDTVKAETTQNTEESKATDQSQTGPTHINSGNSDNGGSDLSEVGLKGIKQNNNGTETVNTAEIADQNYANAAYEASLLEASLLGGNANPNSSHDSSDNNTETNSRSTIIGLNEYSNPKHLGKVTEKLSDTARSIKQVNITPDELKRKHPIAEYIKIPS